MRKWILLGLFVLLAEFATWLGAQRAPDEGRTPLLMRTPVIYYATSEEYTAYEDLCDRLNKINRTFYRADTTTFSVTNFFQAQIRPMFDSWIALQQQAEHAAAIEELTKSAQYLPIEEIKRINSMIKPVTANPPSIP